MTIKEEKHIIKKESLLKSPSKTSFVKKEAQYDFKDSLRNIASYTPKRPLVHTKNPGGLLLGDLKSDSRYLSFDTYLIK